MAKRKRKAADDAKERTIAWYRSTGFSNHPEIQPHELDGIEADFATAESCGLAGVEAADYVMGQLRLRRLGEFSRQRMHDAKTRKMRSAKEHRTAERRSDKRRIADEAMELIRERYPTAAHDNYDGFLKDKAAEELKISRDTLDRWLKYKKISD